MKKQIITILLLLIALTVFFAACTSNNASTANEDGVMDDMTTQEPVAPLPAEEGDDGIMDDMTTQEPVGALPHDNLPQDTQDGQEAMANMPEQLTTKVTPVSTPNFLSQDMQNLYNSAYQMYFCFTVSAGFNVNSSTTFTTTDGMTMYLDNGYATYNDFVTALESMFTQEFIQSELLSGMQYAQGDDGKLYTSEGARGSNIMYVSSEFTLVSATDSEIVMQLVATYNENALLEGEEESLYTQTYDVVLQNTENGWRFSQFAMPI